MWKWSGPTNHKDINRTFQLFNAPTTSSSCTTTSPTTYTIIPTYQLAQTNWSLSILPGNLLQVTAQLFPTWSHFGDGQLSTKTQLTLNWSVPVASLRIQWRDDLFNTGISKDYSGMDLATGEFYSHTSASYSLMVGSWTSSIPNNLDSSKLCVHQFLVSLKVTLHLDTV